MSLDKTRDGTTVNIEKFVSLLDNDEDGKITIQEFYNYFDVMDMMQFERININGHKKPPSGIQNDLRKIIKHPFYDMGIYIFLILNLVFLLVRDWIDQYGGSRDSIKVWITIQIVINFIFTFELLAVVIVDGSILKTFHKMSVKAEILYSVVNVFLLIKFKIYGNYGIENRLLEIIILFRALRILKVLKEVRQWRIILQTIDALISPFYTLTLVQFLLFYLFVIIGDRLFGGTVSVNSDEIFKDQSIPNIYVYMNFNDTLASFVTLFALMVVNNWFVIVNVFVGASGTSMTKIFFILFYVFSVILIINIIVAFVIDMYSSVEELNEEKDKKFEGNNRSEESSNDYRITEESFNDTESSFNNSVRLQNNHKIKVGSLVSSGLKSSKIEESKSLHGSFKL